MDICRNRSSIFVGHQNPQQCSVVSTRKLSKSGIYQRIRMKSSPIFNKSTLSEFFNSLEPINVILATQQYVFTSITYAPNSDVFLFRIFFFIYLLFLSVRSGWHKHRFSDGLSPKKSSTSNNRTYFLLAIRPNSLKTISGK